MQLRSDGALLAAVDMDKVFRASLSLLDKVSQTYHGTPSVPFATSVPNGTVLDTSSQMGFVGKALPSAQLMLLDGLAREDAALVAKATALIDVWVANSMTRSGVPQTWFNTCSPSQPGFDGGRCHPDPEVVGTLRWRADSPYSGHLRIMSEGCLGVLQAYQLIGQPSWLKFAAQYGDFLLSVQAPDGSIAGEWCVRGPQLSSLCVVPGSRLLTGAVGVRTAGATRTTRRRFFGISPTYRITRSPSCWPFTTLRRTSAICRRRLPVPVLSFRCIPPLGIAGVSAGMQTGRQHFNRTGMS